MALPNVSFTPYPNSAGKLRRELELRKRCYQEEVIRGLNAKRPGYDKGWTEQDRQRYGWDASKNAYEAVAEGQGPSLCDILHYHRATLMR